MNKNGGICSFFQDFICYNRDFVCYNQERQWRNYLEPNQWRITVCYKREFVIAKFDCTFIVLHCCHQFATCLKLVLVIFNINHFYYIFDVTHLYYVFDIIIATLTRFAQKARSPGANPKKIITPTPKFWSWRNYEKNVF